MKLRTSYVLKLFAILLFSLENIVITTMVPAETFSKTEVSIQKEIQLFYAIFEEENSGRDNSKDEGPIAYLTTEPSVLFSICLLPNSSGKIRNMTGVILHGGFPLLFKVFCSFLI